MIQFCKRKLGKIGRLAEIDPRRINIDFSKFFSLVREFAAIVLCQLSVAPGASPSTERLGAGAMDPHTRLPDSNGFDQVRVIFNINDWHFFSFLQDKEKAIVKKKGVDGTAVSIRATGLY